MENIYSSRVNELRELMKRENIGLYYIPMDDSHGSEYVADHFRCIEFISGFTGSAGHVIVTMDGAWLYADGRYYIQAENQLHGSGIELMKYAAPGVPDPDVFIISKMTEIMMSDPTKALGFDGKVVNASAAKGFIKNISKRMGLAEDSIPVVCDKDLVNEIWENRPEQSFSELWNFSKEYTGEDTSSKITRIRAELSRESNGQDYIHVISTLDEIAWIFNVRAGDIPCVPECFAYAAISSDKAVLFVNPDCVAAEVAEEMKRQGVLIADYSDTCICAEELKNTLGFSNDVKVIMKVNSMNYLVYSSFADAGFNIIDAKMPSTLMKGCKNEVELKHACDALLRDSANVIRFMYWLKKKAAEAGPENTLKNDDGTPVTEITVDEYLTGLRAEDPLFIDRSFATIAAYKENAAMMHYQAKPDNYKELQAEGMLLVDSGVQFVDGTTDITRTFILGDITEEEKKAFTLTAASMLRLANAKFIEGCSGENLDIMAREPMWENGWDYKCGTGHGVGHVLNVHEGPHSIRWKINYVNPTAVLAKGMVVTDEPGVYRAGKFGIRTENELYVTDFMETEDGTFLQFAQMTFIPIDLDGIEKGYLSEKDIEYLNSYHKIVFEKVSPLLDEETREWLKEYTRAI